MFMSTSISVFLFNESGDDSTVSIDEVDCNNGVRIDEDHDVPCWNNARAAAVVAADDDNDDVAAAAAADDENDDINRCDPRHGDSIGMYVFDEDGGVGGTEYANDEYDDGDGDDGTTCGDLVSDDANPTMSACMEHVWDRE